MSFAYEKNKVKILVADDEDSIRQMLAITLKEDGWDVHEAKNGKEAFELVEKFRPHIVLSDINMPEMTGIELLEKVKAKYSKTEFLIMTSHATLETAVKAVGLGAYDYLHKPFEDVSIVPKSIEKVAEKILLRQQNSELLKRLKSAGQALKRLLETIAPLNSVLEMDQLRSLSVQAFPALFHDQSVKASWWVKEEDSEEWTCKEAHPSKEDFSGITDPLQAGDQLSNARSLQICPLEYKSEVRNILIYESLKPSLGEIFVKQIALTFEKVNHHLDIASLANRDGLTRLYNHRYFQERLRQELSQAKRQKSGVSLVLMDIDHFKHFNDTNGHPAGDEVLRRFARLLSDQKETSSPEGAGRRVTDIVARYGGEEFVMILPFTFYEGAMVKAKRICEAVAETPFEHRETQPLKCVSVSIGVASYPQHADSPEKLVELADKALYQAKARGRNQVVGFDELGALAETQSVQAVEPASPPATLESAETPEVATPEPEAVELKPDAENEIELIEGEVSSDTQETLISSKSLEQQMEDSDEEARAFEKKTLGSILETSQAQEEVQSPQELKPPRVESFDVESLVSAISDAVDQAGEEEEVELSKGVAE